jgi:hypothetical protein
MEKMTGVPFVLKPPLKQGTKTNIVIDHEN